MASKVLSPPESQFTLWKSIHSFIIITIKYARGRSLELATISNVIPLLSTLPRFPLSTRVGYYESFRTSTNEGLGGPNFCDFVFVRDFPSVPNFPLRREYKAKERDGQASRSSAVLVGLLSADRQYSKMLWPKRVKAREVLYSLERSPTYAWYHPQLGITLVIGRRSHFVPKGGRKGW